MIDDQFLLPFASLPALTDDEREDSSFRGKDLAWSCLAGLYDERAAEDPTLNYQTLGDRISRSRAQVQRWIDSPHNMTLRSLSLLAEGLDADLHIDLKKRTFGGLTNTCHPAESAKIHLPFETFKESLRGSRIFEATGLLNDKDVYLIDYNMQKSSVLEHRLKDDHTAKADSDKNTAGSSAVLGA